MKPLTCAAARRRLQAFHDGELAVGDQIAVDAHLDWCDECAAALADLGAVRVALQTWAPGRRGLSNDEAAVFNAGVINRVKAEQEASFVARVREMFDDMHLVYAGLGAAAATVVCVVIVLGMMRFATNERPDSLAAIVNVLATPLECEWGNEVSDPSGCRERWVARFQRANETAEQDALFALEAVVTRQGRLASFDLMRSRPHRAATGQADVIEALLDALSRSRFDGQAMRLPASASMLWLVEHATVRASKAPAALDLQLPPAKKRADVGPWSQSRGSWS
jgi:hypothetical protein